jgi:hypothetical protein
MESIEAGIGENLLKMWRVSVKLVSLLEQLQDLQSTLLGSIPLNGSLPSTEESVLITLQQEFIQLMQQMHASMLLSIQKQKL